MPDAAQLPPESKDQMVRTFDGREAVGADVADCYDPRCKFGCDLGILTRSVPFRKGSTACAPRFDVCSCAINRWQKINPKHPAKEAAHGT